MNADLEEDAAQEEGTAFLGARAKSTRRLASRFIKIAIILFLTFFGLSVLIYTTKLSFPSKLQELIHDPTRSSIVKVTGLYGKGAWIESEVPDIATKLSSKKRQDNLERAVSIHKNHAKLHGHGQIVQKVQLFGKNINNAYTKIGNLLEQNLLEMSLGPELGAKWLFWHDVDTTVLNNKVGLYIFVSDIPELDKFNFLYTEDYNGLNAGLFFLRVSEWTSLFLANVLAIARPQGTEQLPFWEQGAIVKTLKDNSLIRKASVAVPKEWFNQYPKLSSKEGTQGLSDEISPGSFILHMAGDTKFNPGWFEHYLDIGGGSDPSHHNASAALTLRESVQRFWKLHAENVKIE